MTYNMCLLRYCHHAALAPPSPILSLSAYDPTCCLMFLFFGELKCYLMDTQVSMNPTLTPIIGLISGVIVLLVFIDQDVVSVSGIHQITFQLP